MEAIIRKWGNSSAVRLPASAIRQAEFGPDQKVTITVTRGRIVIVPCDKVEYDLDHLLGGITPDNTHPQVVFGRPVGKETL